MERQRLVLAMRSWERNLPFSTTHATRINGRSEQQDAYAILGFRRFVEGPQFPTVAVMVADGMGGHTRVSNEGTITGADASAQAVSTFNRVKDNLRLTRSAFSYVLENWAKVTNSAIYQLNQGQSQRESVGTTLASVLVSETAPKTRRLPGAYEGRFLAVGDTAIMKISSEGGRNRVEQRSFNERIPGQQNVLTHSVGQEPSLTLYRQNTGDIHLSSGEGFLVATDGLTGATFEGKNGTRYHSLEKFLSYDDNWKSVSSRRLFRPREPRRLDAKKLVAKAQNVDNATAVVVYVK